MGKREREGGSASESDYGAKTFDTKLNKIAHTSAASPSRAPTCRIAESSRFARFKRDDIRYARAERAHTEIPNADAETLFTASRSPPSVLGPRVDHSAGSHARVNRSAVRRNRDAEYLEFPLCHRTLRRLSLARAIPVSTFLSLSPSRRERQQQVSAGTFAETGEGCERVETAAERRGQRALRERARENSSSLFMSFLFDLLSSRSRPPLSFSLSLVFALPTRTRVQIGRDGQRQRVGKRAESTRGDAPSPERVPEISRLPGAEKMRHFSA